MSESKSASVVFTNGSLLAKNAQVTADSAKSAAQEAQALASGAQKTADGKNSVYRGSDPATVPTANLKSGDIYFTDNAMYTWTGTSWEKTVSDTTGAEIHAKVEAAMQESQKAVTDLKSDVEAKVKDLDDEIAKNRIQTGNALNFYKEQYYQSTSYTELAGGSWSDEVPGKVKGKYVWSRYVTANIGDSTNYQYSDPVCISGLDGEQGPQGPTGATGPQGPQGVTGAKGADGQTTYVHVAYANSADGNANFSVNYFADALYVGVLTDYTQADSNDYTQYTWSRLKGDTGTSFKLFTTNYTYDQYEIDAYSGSGYSGTWSVNESTSELRVGDTVQLRCTNSSKAGYSFIIAKVTAIPSDKEITCVSSGLIDKGDTGDQGIPGPKGDNGQTTYVHFAYANSADGQTNFNTSYFSNALYVGTYTDYTQTDSGDYTKYTWSRLKGDTGNTGATGPQGPQGVAGAKGADGQTTYVHVAYANSSDGKSDFNTSYFSDALYVGVLTDNTQADSNDYTKYTWSRLKGDTGATGPQGPKGDTGNQGIPGPKGIDGQTTYVHFAYANSADGNINFNTSYFADALYVGTYTDYTQTDSSDYTQYTWSRLKGDTGTSFKLFTTNYTYDQNGIDSYSGSGYTGTWSVNESTSELKVGDIVQLRCTNTSKAGYSFIIAKVTAIPGDKTIVCVSSGLVDKGDTGPTGATGAKGDTGSTGFFIGTTPPPNPVVGTVWATNDASGNMVSAKKWNGSNWVSTAFTQDLVAGDITADKIVGGTLDVNKITIKNAQNIPVESTVSLGKKLSDIVQNADGITSTVRNGGVNLLNNSQGNFQPKNSVISNWQTFQGVDVYMTQGKKYTVSAQAAPGFVFSGTDDRTVESNRITLWLTDVSNNHFWTMISSDTTDVSLGGTHFTWNYASGTYTLCVNSYKKDNSGYAYHVQIEYGDIATPWQPSNGDISVIQQTASSLNAYVKHSNGSNTLAAILSMDPNNSVIGQVVNGNLVAGINMSSDGDLKIVGNKLHITADTKIENAVIKAAMIDSIDASKILTGELDAEKVKITHLTADKIASGTLNGVTITGSTFISKSTNASFDGVSYSSYQVTIDNYSLRIAADDYYGQFTARGWRLSYVNIPGIDYKVIDANLGSEGNNPYIQLGRNGSKTTIDSQTVQASNGTFGNFVLAGNNIRVLNNKYLLVANSAGTNFDNNGSVIFQVWGGVTLGQNTIAVPSNDFYVQQGNADNILTKSYSDAGKVSIHCNKVISQVANTVSSRLSVKTDITKVTYDRALAAVEGTDMYDYRYVSDDSGQHYVSGIIDDVNADPQYHMDGMLINKERTARIDANLVGYHQVVIQKLLERVAALEEKVK